jgi:Uma2 family endonuclease
MVAEREIAEKQNAETTIPKYLIREEFGGKKWYYKGYRDVLNKTKKNEEIMGSSSLQSMLVYAIGFYLGNLLDRKKYRLASNEAGLHLAKNENLANDVAVYIKDNAIATNKYFDVAPRLVIEVDIKVDFSEVDEEHKDFEYVLEKSQLMIDFGVERIIWISTITKKIMVFSKTERWYITSFDETVPLFDEYELNLAALLKEEDLEF